jgi:release factor glutamine methyltransferase
MALVMAAERRDAHVIGLDISRRAVWNARWNARRLALANVQFRRGSLLEGLPAHCTGRSDLILANLPWIPPVVRLHYEHIGNGWRGPPWSIQGSGADGLGEVRELARIAWNVLAPAGVLVLQLGEWQTPSFAAELDELGYRSRLAAPGVLRAQKT